MSAVEKLIKSCVVIRKTEDKPPTGEILYLQAVF
jgi:hypothetical protein